MYLHFLAKKRTFSKEEMKAIETFGTNAAIAIEKAKSYEDLRELYGLERIINSNIKLDDVALDIGKSAKKLEPNAVFHIFLYDEMTGLWDYLSTTKEANSREAILATHKPRANGIGDKAIRTKEPITIGNLETNEIADPIAITQGIKATAAFPLEVRECVIGVSYFHFFETKTFSEDEILRLSMFTSKVAIAINNALKYANLEKIIIEIEELRGANKINERLLVKPEGFNFDAFIENIIKIDGSIAGLDATERR
jgi:GAF domain-containing protein